MVHMAYVDSHGKEYQVIIKDPDYKICVSLTNGPCWIFSIQGLPTRLSRAISFALATNASYIPSCTNVRDPAQQFCPWLKNNAS